VNVIRSLNSKWIKAVALVAITKLLVRLLKRTDTAVVEIDSVIGSKGGKYLLTIHFVDCSLMLAFLRDANTSKSVTDIFNQLDKELGKDIFNRLFHIIFTDNGSEFSNLKTIEHRESAPFWRTNVFYCDVGSPYQKGAIEVNQEYFRKEQVLITLSRKIPT